MRCSLFKQSFSKFQLTWYNAENKILKKSKMETSFSTLNLHPSGFDIAGVRFCCDLHICWNFFIFHICIFFQYWVFFFNLWFWVKIEWWWSLNRCRKREEIEWWWSLNRCRKREEIEWWWSLNRCRKREEIEWWWSLNTFRKGRGIIRGCCG